MSEKYNGWTNYETWAVALWLDNDESSYKHWRSVARECWDEAEAHQPFSRRESAALALRTCLKDEIEDGHPLTDPSLYSDLLTGALSEVNWLEIATNWLNETQPPKRRKAIA